MKIRLTLFGLLLTLANVWAQQKDWNTSYSKPKVFIENLGQFDQDETPTTGSIRYAIDFGGTRIFFGDKGVSYRFLEATKIPKAQREELRKKLGGGYENHKKYERLVGKFKFKSDEVGMRWEKANSSVEVIGIDAPSDYHNYSFKNAQGISTSVSHAKGFNKIIYTNIYPNIDIEYIVHPEIGIKYALILHPGADPTSIRMVFDRDIALLDGKISIPTSFGAIIDHEPITFLKESPTSIIPSKFIQEGRSIHFEIADYDNSKTLVIDPWTQTPSFATNWDCVWEIEKDASGNVYALGGIMPMQILKYNAAGTLQWTYNTPYDTSNVWLGTFAVDNAGNSYVTAGSTAQIQKVNTSGAVAWNNTSPGGAFSSSEFWTIAFNCDQTSLVVGGTGGSGFPVPNLEAYIYNINVANGNVSNTASVAVGPATTIPPNVQEIRAISAGKNGKYYWLTQDTIGYINDNFTLCSNGSTSLQKINNGIDFGYKCENYRYDNSGICAVKADANAFYVNTGAQLQKRNLITGAIISSVAIPNGTLSSGFGGSSVANSGIDIDDCGNIYVGSTTGVYKFNSSLVQQANYATSFKVYDVVVSSGGNVIACGGTGDNNSTTRSGGIQSFSAAGACSPLTTVCCDATICQPSAVCATAPAFTLTAATSGGTWSGPGVNATTGVFSPSVAGAGTHTITYTLACGSESITITVNSCATLQVCKESNGTYTVSGGTAPYTWQKYTPAQTVTINNQATCQSCGYSWTFGQCLNGFMPATSCTTAAGYTTFATGSNASIPSGTTQIQILDNTGGTVVISDITTIQTCSANPCSGVTIAMSTTSQTNVSCANGNNGSATVSASGGSAPYSYSWSPGGGTGASRTNLTAGTYTLTITDANNCTGTGTVTITQPTVLSASTTVTGASCGGSNGSATAIPSGGTSPYTYAWSPSGGTNATASNLASGSYTVTVTDANLCTATANATITSAGGPSISVASSTNISCFGLTNGSATVSGSGGNGSLNYTWSPGNLTGTSQTSLSANTYTVTVTDASNCSNSITVTITEPAELVLSSVSTTPANCGSSDGEATVSVTGGTGNVSLSWSPSGGTGTTASNLNGGIYTVTATDQNNCQDNIQVVIATTGGPTVSISSSNDVSCNNGSNGSATASASGGTAPYTYQWSPTGGNQATAANLTAGTYTVAVSDASSCVGTATVTINEPIAIAITETIVPMTCGSFDGSISLVVTNGAAPYTYSWTPSGETTAAINSLAAGNYGVTVSDANGCTITESYTVGITGSITINVTPDSYNILAGDTVSFLATGADNYTWTSNTNLSCTDCDNPISVPTQTSTYIIVGTDNTGCSDTAIVMIYVQEICGETFVPNVFSPDNSGDARNNSVCVLGGCFQQLDFAIYDRWGKRVFETTDASVCWDGTYKGVPLNAGVFAYKLIATLNNGKYVQQSGNITLIK